ncbi:MAG: hypothetical protein E6G07_00510 [Actinobacteria bacterium]|nr:MAG: hypothetical protein E6G07_00510 [Actinomycetota bacterium]
MAPLITRLVQTVVPAHAAELGDCLVCREPVRDDGEAVRLSGGGYVHLDCTTYRMRQRARRPLRRASRNGYREFTGE